MNVKNLILDAECFPPDGSMRDSVFPASLQNHEFIWDDHKDRDRGEKRNRSWANSSSYGSGWGRSRGANGRNGHRAIQLLAFCLWVLDHPPLLSGNISYLPNMLACSILEDHVIMAVCQHGWVAEQSGQKLRGRPRSVTNCRGRGRVGRTLKQVPEYLKTLLSYKLVHITSSLGSLPALWSKNPMFVLLYWCYFFSVISSSTACSHSID